MHNRVVSCLGLAALALSACTAKPAPSATTPIAAAPVKPAVVVGTFDVSFSSDSSSIGAPRAKAVFTPIPDARDGDSTTNPPATLQVWSDPFVLDPTTANVCGASSMSATVHVRSAFTEKLRNLYAEVTQAPVAFSGCLANRPAGAPLPASNLGAFDYGGDLSGTTVTTGATLSSTADALWAFFHPNDTPFVVRAALMAQPLPPAPAPEPVAYLETGASLEWFVDETPTTDLGLVGLVDVATDAAFATRVVDAQQVSVGTSPVRRIFSAGDAPADFANPTSAYWLGVQFHADRPGFVNGVYFYRGEGEGAGATGDLTLCDVATITTLAQVADPGAGTGWNYVAFAQPVHIVAGRDYVVSRPVPPNGGWPRTANVFAGGATIQRGPLHATTGVFTDVYEMPGIAISTNYWIDLSFTDEAAFTYAPGNAVTSGSSYYWRTRNRFNYDALPANGAIDGTLVGSGGSFTVTPALSAVSFTPGTRTLEFTAGGDVTSLLLEICSDASAPTAVFCQTPQPPDTFAVTGAGTSSHVYASTLPSGTHYWRVTQQFPGGAIGKPSAWTSFVVP